MSLFEDDSYIYRDTFFIYIQDENRPTVAQVSDCFAQLGSKYEVVGMRERDGKFGSVTIKSPQDSSAMDITYVTGEEVHEQIGELMLEFRTMTLTGDDREKLTAFETCNARFDIFHFEQQSGSADAGPDEMIDPGGLLLVIERLASLVGGVALDPQSHTIL
jgi:hypothetical protein